MFKTERTLKRRLTLDTRHPRKIMKSTAVLLLLVLFNVVLAQEFGGFFASLRDDPLYWKGIQVCNLVFFFEL